MTDRVRDIHVGALTVDPTNPRTAVGDVDDLAASIAELGLQDPLIVRYLGNHADGEPCFGVIAGQRRLAAVLELGWQTVRCEIRDLDDTAAAIAAAADNMARRQLNAMEEARTYRRLLDVTGLTQADLGRRLGVSQATITQRLKLLDLPDDVQELVAAGEISTTEAYRLAKRTRGALKAPRRRPESAHHDDEGVLEPVVLSADLLRAAGRLAERRREHPVDLIARAIRRELRQPTCKRCETRPALTGIGSGTSCGPGCPGPATNRRTA